MSICAYGVKPLPETCSLVVGGPSLGDSVTAACPKQNPASNKVAMPSQQICPKLCVERPALLAIMASLVPLYESVLPEFFCRMDHSCASQQMSGDADTR